MIGNALEWLAAAFLVFLIACINALVVIASSLPLLAILLVGVRLVWKMNDRI